MRRGEIRCGLRPPRKPVAVRGAVSYIASVKLSGVGLPDLCQSLVVFPWARRRTNVTGTLTLI